MSRVIHDQFHKLGTLQSQRLASAEDTTSPYNFGPALVATKQNRYRDILPFTYNRVKLSNEKDYINASHIKAGEHQWIAAQGPLENTAIDFWEMVSQYSQVVLMLCNVLEDDRRKCAQYFPMEVHQVKTFIGGDRTFNVKCIEIDDFPSIDLTVRSMNIKFVGADYGFEKIIKHLHFHQWPDHGVASLDILSKLIEKFDTIKAQTAVLNKSAENIPTVHCSAGCGRTCTFIALHSLTANPTQNIYDLVNELRTQRIYGVQTQEQFELLYQYAERRKASRN